MVYIDFEKFFRNCYIFVKFLNFEKFMFFCWSVFGFLVIVFDFVNKFLNVCDGGIEKVILI